MDATPKFDMRIPFIALISAVLAGAAAFYGLQTRVSLLEIRAHAAETHVTKQSNQIDLIRADAEASRGKMQQSVGEIKELLIELRANSRRLEDRISDMNKKEKQ